MRVRAIALVPLAAAAAASVGGYAFWIQNEVAGAGAPVIDLFRQTSPSTIEVEFDRGITDVSIAALADVPAVLNQTGAPLGQALQAKDGTVVIPLDEAARTGEYSVVLRVLDGKCAAVPGILMHVGLWPACSEPRYVEIIRQPSSWLASTFNFDRPQGYSILGRRTLDVHAGKEDKLSVISLAGIADLDLAQAPEVDLPQTLASHAELAQSARLLNFIWSRALRGGPTSLPYDAFMRETFDRKLELLAKGDTSAQCQGVRDLFLHATTGVPGLKARAVEAFNYWPQFADLVPYGHSTAEVWVEGLQKWVIVDPWMGFALTDGEGRFLSADDLLPGHRPAAIHPVALAPKVRRYSQTSTGKRVDAILSPGEIGLDAYTYTPVGHAPGYLTYFETVRYRDYKID